MEEENIVIEVKPNLYEKLNMVQQELKAPKNQRNTFGGYNYRSCEDILEAVKPLLHKYRLSLTIRDDIDERNGKIYIKAFATLVDVDKPEDKIISTAEAREADQKKGMDDSQITGATSSYARKYLLNGLFLIDDTKDADTDEYAEQTREEKVEQPKYYPISANGNDKISEGQAKRLFAISGGDQELVRLTINNYGYTNTRDILKKDYDGIAAEIELKAKGVEVNAN